MFTFIETRLFTKLADELLGDDQLSELQLYLSENPEVGDIIRGSGGVRKMRWAMPGRGKRGGMKVIYYLRSRQGQIGLLRLYPKNVADNISSTDLRSISEEIDGKG
jgi:hypothetical protein